MKSIDITHMELSAVKEEIKQAYAEFFSSMNLKDHEKGLVIFFMKKIVFLKYLTRSGLESYELKSLLSDFIYLLNSVQENNIRYFYLNTRSIIENFLRLTNDLNSENTITNKELMDKTKLLVENRSIDNINFQIILEEYDKACKYIHGNVSVNMPLAKVFNDCLGKEYSKIDVILKQTSRMVDELLIILASTKKELVDSSFFRRKSILEYLTNAKIKDIIMKD